MLNNPPSVLSNVGAKGPLYLVPTILSWTELFVLRGGITPNEHLVGLIKQFKESANSITSGESQLAASTQAFEVSRAIADLVDSSSADPLSVNTWEKIIEILSQTWGDRPTILYVASAICELGRKKRTNFKNSGLFERDKPICHRIRSAKSFANNPAWWRSQLSLAASGRERFLFHLLYWSRVPTKIILEMGDEIGAALDSLSAEEWTTVLRFVPRAMDRHPHVHPKSTNLVLPALRSTRLAVLLAFRDQRTLGRQIFLTYLANSDESHPVVAELRQYHALEAAGSEAISWEQALATIRMTYLGGAAYRIAQLLLMGRPFKIPRSTAQHILEHPNDYPALLWDQAELIATAAVRKNVKAVGVVARKQRWFSA